MSLEQFSNLLQRCETLHEIKELREAYPELSEEEKRVSGRRAETSRHQEEV